MTRQRQSFPDYLRQLVDTSRRLSAAGLRRLSNLDQSELADLSRIWPSIAVARRREIVKLAEEIAEDNVELDFSGLFRMALSDQDDAVRIAAVTGLSEDEDRTTADALLVLLTTDSSPNVRAAAATALGQFSLLVELGKLKDPLAQRIDKALLDTWQAADQSVEVRRRALEALGYRSIPEVVQAIEAAYASGDAKLRASALFAMGRNADRRWLDIVGRELESPDPELRFEAARACGEIGEPVMVKPLIKLVVDRDLEVRLAAITALGEIGGPQAKEALQELLRSDEPSVRDAAADALAAANFGEEPLDLQGMLDDD